MKSTFQVWINNIQTLLSLENDAWVIYWLLKLMRLDFIGVLLENEVIKPVQTGNVGDQTWSKIVWWPNISLFGPCLIVSGHQTFPVWTGLYSISLSLPSVVDSWPLVKLVLRCLLVQLLIPCKYHLQLAQVSWHCPQ